MSAKNGMPSSLCVCHGAFQHFGPQMRQTSRRLTGECFCNDQARWQRASVAALLLHLPLAVTGLVK